MRWWWHAPCALKATAQPGNWQNRLSEPVVPLSKIQSAVLWLLAAHRDPEGDERFSPTMRNETFGYVLHPVDLAMNKAMAAPGGVRCVTLLTS